MEIIARIEPQPPKGIRYMLGNESWLPVEKRSPLYLFCEEWGNMGPLELRPDVQDNGHGFRVRTTEIMAPPGALGVTDIDGVSYWTDTDVYGRTAKDISDAALALRESGNEKGI